MLINFPAVLIQPNLRFYHELFGWEVELAKQEAEEGTHAHCTYIDDGYGPRMDESMSLPVIVGRRRILYSWPAFCRELVSEILLSQHLKYRCRVMEPYGAVC